MFSVLYKLSKILKVLFMDIIRYDPVSVPVFKIVISLIAYFLGTQGPLGKRVLYLAVFVYHEFDAPAFPGYGIGKDPHIIFPLRSVIDGTVYAFQL